MATKVSDRSVHAVRSFNRFYTRRIGVLHEGLLRSPYSLTEARVLFEVAERGDVTARDLAADLELDAGYLSRLLKRLESQGLLARGRSREDGRRRPLRLTRKGRGVFDGLNESSAREVAGLLGELSGDDRARLLGALRTVEELLGDEAREPGPIVVREHRPGDLGWVLHRHAALYSEDYGWTQEFEALVARIVADFLTEFDPQRDRGFVAEREGEILGTVFLVKEDDDTARLRLLLVEHAARGMGLGKRLVDECLGFARAAGYRRVRLWTDSILTAARRIYEAAGFRLVETETHSRYGPELVGESWELDLAESQGDLGPTSPPAR